MNNKNVAVCRKCYDCGQTMEGRRENYRYSECGLDSVTLVDVLVFHCKCGAIAPEIPGVEFLHQAIGLDLLRKNSLLAGDEIRFLRKMAGYTATKLASIMGVTKEVVSRWENGKARVGKESDRFLRFVCFDGIIRCIDPDSAGKSHDMLEFAKRVQSFNLPEVIELVEEYINDPKPIRINPDTLCGIVTPETTSAIQ